MKYSALARIADDLLKRNGLAVKVTRAGANVGTANALFTGSEAKNETSSSSSYMAQTSKTTKTVLLSGLAKEPQTDDLMVADKKTYRITSVEAVRPGTTTVLYRLEVI